MKHVYVGKKVVMKVPQETNTLKAKTGYQVGNQIVFPPQGQYTKGYVLELNSKNIKPKQSKQLRKVWDYKEENEYLIHVTPLGKTQVKEKLQRIQGKVNGHPLFMASSGNVYYQPNNKPAVKL